MRKFSATLLSLICISSLPSANAFTLIMGPQNQVTTGWENNTVTFDIDTSCGPYLNNVYSAIDVAAKTWGAVSTSALKVKRGSIVSLPFPITTYVGGSASSYAPVGNTIIYCDTSFAANSGADANSIPGFAGAQNLTSSGRLQGSLLVLNVQVGAAASITALDSTLLSVVLTHEIGHCLGFGHSANREALMYYASGAGRQAVLAKDDIDAVTYLYPNQELGKSFPGCSSMAAMYKEQGRRGGGGNGAVSGFFKAIGAELALLMLFLILIRLPKLSVIPNRTNHGARIA